MGPPRVSRARGHVAARGLYLDLTSRELHSVSFPLTFLSCTSSVLQADPPSFRLLRGLSPPYHHDPSPPPLTHRGGALLSWSSTPRYCSPRLASYSLDQWARAVLSAVYHCQCWLLIPRQLIISPRCCLLLHNAADTATVLH